MGARASPSASRTAARTPRAESSPVRVKVRVRVRVKVRVRARVRCCALPMVSSHGGARSPVAAPGDMGEIWGRYIGEI